MAALDFDDSMQLQLLRENTMKWQAVLYHDKKNKGLFSLRSPPREW